MCPVLHLLGTEPEADQSHGSATGAPLPQGDRGVAEGEGEGGAHGPRRSHPPLLPELWDQGPHIKLCAGVIESTIVQSSGWITSTGKGLSSALLFMEGDNRQMEKRRGAGGGPSCLGSQRKVIMVLLVILATYLLSAA